jgi:hypothetical protein
VAQHDYVIANGTGAAVRSDLNNALAAIVSQNSGATEPATMYAYQWWADTTTGLLKLRNGANNAWIVLRELDGTLTIEDGTASSPGLAFADDLNTGVFSPGADQVAFTAGGTARLTATTTGITSALPVDVPLGSASAPTITFTGDLNTGIYSPGADQVAVATNGVQRINIEADGDINIDGGGVFYDATNNRLAIGTTSPGAPLDVVGSADTFVLSSNATNSTTKEAKIQCRHYTNAEENLMLLYGFSTSTDNAVVLGGGAGNQNAATTVRFFTAADTTTTSGSERARIDSSGRLLVGTSTARSNFFNSTVSSQFQVEGTSTTGRIISVISSSSDGNEPPFLVLGKQNSGTVGGNTAVASGANVGVVSFQANDGTEFVEAARIEAQVDGTPGANDMPGRLVFSTTADGASSPTERMRISQNGIVSINGTGSIYNARLTCFSQTGVSASAFSTDTATEYGTILRNTATSGNNGFALFETEATPATRGSITYNRGGGVVAYNTTSDYRAKTLLGVVENPGETIDALKIYRGVMNGATVERPMLVAHEAQEVAPYCVTGEKDAVDDDGNPIYQQMDHQVLVPLLIAEIQQLRARVAALETQ